MDSLVTCRWGGGIIVLHTLDDEIQDYFYTHNPLGASANLFNLIGNPITIGSIALTTHSTATYQNSLKNMLITESLLEALTLTYLTTIGLKYITLRKRPDGSDDHSFPSGHTSGSFTVAAVLSNQYGPKIGIPCYLLATVIAISRLDANEHYLTDIAAGALIGTVFGIGTSQFHKKSDHRLLISPLFSDSGIVVTFLF